MRDESKLTLTFASGVLIGIVIISKRYFLPNSSLVLMRGNSSSSSFSSTNCSINTSSGRRVGTLGGTGADCGDGEGGAAPRLALLDDLRGEEEEEEAKDALCICRFVLILLGAALCLEASGAARDSGLGAPFIAVPQLQLAHREEKRKGKKKKNQRSLLPCGWCCTTMQPPTPAAASVAAAAAMPGTSAKPTVLVVIGMAGSGKTTFMQVRMVIANGGYFLVLKNHFLSA